MPPRRRAPTPAWRHGSMNCAGRAPGFPAASEADCRNVETRAAGGRTEVFIGRDAFGSRAPNGWVVVPPSHVLTGLENPTGGPIACWAAWGGVLCFVPGSGT